MSGWMAEKTFAKRLVGFINGELQISQTPPEKIISELEKMLAKMKKQFHEEND